jgi:eukaryotic-like serine/threonine-protein kinase
MPVDDDLLQRAMNALDVTGIEPLRHGGQKTVWLVENGSGQLVMKVIALESDAPQALERAKREVELLQTIDSDHVVRVASDLVDIDDPPAAVAWLEEHLDGDDLSDHLGQPWEWGNAKAMATQVAVGLAALHDAKVVHRDLSAANIRRTPEGRYVVMDPGFARHTLRSGLTVGGQPGTRGYLSPEHLKSYSGVPTPSSDVFCVGILLFVSLTTKLPISYSGDDGDYFARLELGQMLDIAALRPDLSAEVVSLVRRVLHPQPARRPRNGHRLKEALEVVDQ